MEMAVKRKFRASRDVIFRTNNWAKAANCYGSVLGLPVTHRSETLMDIFDKLQALLRIIQDTTASSARGGNSLLGKSRNLVCEIVASEFGFCLPNSLSNSPINL